MKWISAAPLAWALFAAVPAGAADQSPASPPPGTMMMMMGPKAAAPAAAGAPVTLGGLTIERAWTRATPGPNAGAFVTIRNDGDSPDRLTGAATEAAKTVQLHSSMMEGEVMRMRPIDSVEIPAHGRAELAPGHLHIMLLNLAHPLALGETVPLRLTFEKAGSVTVPAVVEAMATPHPGPMSGMPMEHGK